MDIHDSLEITAERLDAEGRGVGRAGDRAVHVPDLLPRERGRVTVEHVSPHRPEAWARLEARLADAPERVVPPCPAFGRCGGCAWQHLAYIAQLDEKRRRVVDALGPAAAVDEVVPSPREGRYRNLGKYVIGAGPGGDILLGAYAPRSHELVPTLGCAVVEPVIDEVAQALPALLAASGLDVYDERRRTGQLRYALIRANAEGEALVGLVTTSDAARKPLQTIAWTLQQQIEAVRGVIWVRNDATTGALLSDDQRRLVGSPTIDDRLGELTLEIGVGTFFQINRDQAARMYAAVADWLAGARQVVDVYCGVGGIALTIAQRGVSVLGIERNPDSIAAARAAATRNGLDRRSRFEVATADQVASLAADADAVVVNPPRKGLSATTRKALIALAPARIAYVSCNPDTLARDLRALEPAGYRLERAVPFDLMLGMAQIETIAFIVRANPA